MGHLPPWIIMTCGLASRVHVSIMDESWGVAAVVRDMSRIFEGFKITLPRPTGPGPVQP